MNLDDILRMMLLKKANDQKERNVKLALWGCMPAQLAGAMQRFKLEWVRGVTFGSATVLW